MDELWEQIESWLSVNAPSVLEALAVGASDADLDRAEAALQVHFPADFRESYLRHNGSLRPGEFLFPSGEFLPVKRILAEWREWKDQLDDGAFSGAECEPHRGIHRDWFNARWIPFTRDIEGNHVCLDLAPSAWGAIGQVITLYQESPERELAAHSFRDYLEILLDRLHSGEYVYSPDYGGIVSADDL